MKAYERLGRYIHQYGFKQKTVARNAGLSEQQLSYILNGRKVLSADDLERICLAMGTTPDAIYKMKVD